MRAKQVVDPTRFGVSFSIKQCRSFNIDPAKTLKWLISDAGFRRFRLMSYWNEHEKQPGKFDFKELDRQVRAIERAGGVITLSLGARQPRWPENHWPNWAWKLNKDDRSQALLRYIETVVERYKDRECIISYQLENEALLKDFGERPEIDRLRLRQEYELVKWLDPSRPVIMTTSTSWGIPIRRPIPDMFGFSFYHTLYRKGGYHHSTFAPWIHRLRKRVIFALHQKRAFIHELQLEPWGPTAIWKMNFSEQAKSMSIHHITENVRLARKIKAAPIDLWGGEWWYWRQVTHKDPTIWDAVSEAIHTK
ncbi:MAG: hypothetical protein JWO35_662 [Candidatus Saccharibacteria bacterium]|nr:hypothetical protein [Candidatus Saccharibacteria bacterium]